MNKMTETDTANRCLTLSSREYANSLAGMGFGEFAGSDFVSPDVQAVVGTIGWRIPAPRVTHAQAQTTKPAIRTIAPMFETSHQAPQAAMKQTRVLGLAKAAKDADRGVEGTARKRIPV